MMRPLASWSRLSGSLRKQKLPSDSPCSIHVLTVMGGREKSQSGVRASAHGHRFTTLQVQQQRTQTHTKTHRHTQLYWGYSREVDGIGHDQQVLVVEQAHFGHLHDEEVEQLDEEHEEEFPDAADLQEDRAGEQTEQHAAREVLREETGEFDL